MHKDIHCVKHAFIIDKKNDLIHKSLYLLLTDSNYSMQGSEKNETTRKKSQALRMVVVLSFPSCEIQQEITKATRETRARFSVASQGSN